MVSERQIQVDSGTDYDNLSSTPNTDTDEKTITAESTCEESSSSQRSSSSTPTIQHCDREENAEKPKSSNATTTINTGDFIRICSHHLRFLQDTGEKNSSLKCAKLNNQMIH
ncbi:unnamed protein product [Anisakis simplex]|uniref:Uncharacterized protein n=1 Tax=Anisakis simplex TaxID=6269 RepID=A0A0M3J466_ANISI|nr:unnamed protein product [Anisakis simplex]